MLRERAHHPAHELEHLHHELRGTVKLTARTLTHYYGEHRALDQVSFDLRGPLVVGLLGRNGAGKSTLLRHCAGLKLPSDGEVLVADAPLYANKQTSITRIGYMPETPALHDEALVSEFLIWCAMLRGVSRDDATARSQRVLEDCHLQDVATKPISALSHGYRKRVGIAQAIIHGPDIILLDEPLSGLDPAQIAQMRQVITALGERALVIVSTHVLAEIARTCQHLLVLSSGELVADLPADRLGEHTEQGALVKLELSAPSARAIKDTLDDIPFILTSSTSTLSHAANLHALDVRISDERHVEDLCRALVHAGFGLRHVTTRSPDRADHFESFFLHMTNASTPQEEE